MTILSAALLTVLLASASPPANTDQPKAATKTSQPTAPQQPATLKIGELAPAIRTHLSRMEGALPASAWPRLEAARRSYEITARSGDSGNTDSLAQACVRRHFRAATRLQVELLSALLLFEYGKQERRAIDKLEADLQRNRDSIQLLQAETRLMEEVRQQRGLKWRPTGKASATRLPFAQGYSRDQLRQMNAERLQDAYFALQKQQQEVDWSFNMQYLTLQQKMQDEARVLTFLSNIMKTKHDTALNSIQNVR